MYIYTNVLCFFLLTIIFNEGWALKCYECLGPPNGGCANAVNTDFIKEPCSKDKFMHKPLASYFQLENAAEVSVTCVQADVVIRNTTTVVGRVCGFAPQGADYCRILETMVKVNSCSTCDTDYCNSKPIM